MTIKIITAASSLYLPTHLWKTGIWNQNRLCFTLHDCSELCGRAVCVLSCVPLWKYIIVILMSWAVVGVVPCGISSVFVGWKDVGGWCDVSGTCISVWVKDESSVYLPGSRIFHMCSSGPKFILSIPWIRFEPAHWKIHGITSNIIFTVKYKPKVAMEHRRKWYSKIWKQCISHHYQEMKANILIYLQFRISAGFQHAVHKGALEKLKI